MAMGLYSGGGGVDLPATLRDAVHMFRAIGYEPVLIGGIALFAYDPDPPATGDVDFAVCCDLAALVRLCSSSELAGFGFTATGAPRRRVTAAGKIYEKPAEAILTTEFVQVFHLPELTPLHVACLDVVLDASDEVIHGVALPVATIHTLLRTKAIAVTSWRRPEPKRLKDLAAIISLLQNHPEVTLDEFADLPAAARHVIEDAFQRRGDDAAGWREVT